MSNRLNLWSCSRLSRWTLTAGTWNVRSLVEIAGRDQRITASEGIVDRKIDLMVKELRRCRVSVGVIQETKWFGSDVW